MQTQGRQKDPHRGYATRALHLHGDAVDELARGEHVAEHHPRLFTLVQGDVVRLPFDLNHAVHAVVHVHRLLGRDVVDDDGFVTRR